MKPILFAILLMPCISLAQETTTAAGGVIANNSIEANWTIGDLVSETLISNTTALTSGVSQPMLSVVLAIEDSQIDSISFFPNPTDRLLNIVYDGTLPIILNLFSNDNSAIVSLEVTNRNTVLDFSSFASGLYFLKLQDSSGKTNTYRIIKK
jgi:hypothetical protein